MRRLLLTLADDPRAVSVLRAWSDDLLAILQAPDGIEVLTALLTAVRRRHDTPRGPCAWGGVGTLQRHGAHCQAANGTANSRSGALASGPLAV
jgi:hypothetical protein